MCMQKAAEAMVSICRGTKKLRTKLGVTSKWHTFSFAEWPKPKLGCLSLKSGPTFQRIWTGVCLFALRSEWPKRPVYRWPTSKKKIKARLVSLHAHIYRWCSWKVHQHRRSSKLTILAETITCIDGGLGGCSKLFLCWINAVVLMMGMTTAVIV